MIPSDNPNDPTRDDRGIVPSIRAVGAIVYRVGDNRQIEILLIRKRGSSWSLPKGKLKSAESHDAGLLRELKEETGIKGIVEEIVGEAIYAIPKRSRATKVVSYYLVRWKSGKLRPSVAEKIEDVAWKPLNQAIALLRRRPRLRTLVRAAQSLLVSAVP